MVDLHAMMISLVFGLAIMVPIYAVIYAIVSSPGPDEHDKRVMVRSALDRNLADTGPIGPRHLAEV